MFVILFSASSTVNSLYDTIIPFGLSERCLSDRECHIFSCVSSSHALRLPHHQTVAVTKESARERIVGTGGRADVGIAVGSGPAAIPKLFLDASLDFRCFQISKIKV